MKRLIVQTGKVLKLKESVVRYISDGEMENIDNIVLQMENYIKSKGVHPIGPLIQCSETVFQDDGSMEMKVSVIRQVDSAIDDIESPYLRRSHIKTNPSLFVRYIGDEAFIKVAYDKLYVYSYEEEINLSGKTFTVFTGNGNDGFSADIFVEMK